MQKQRITTAPIGDLEIELGDQVITISGYGSDECGVNCEATVHCEFANVRDVERFLEALTSRRDIEASFPLTSGQLVRLNDFQKDPLGEHGGRELSLGNTLRECRHRSHLERFPGQGGCA